MAVLTLDTGVLIAADRNDRRAWTLKALCVVEGIDMQIPTTVLAQAWRGPRNANLARFLRGCVVTPLEEDPAKATGVLCGEAGTEDIVDASVAVTAGADGRVVTTDPVDLTDLCERIGASVKPL